MSVYQQAGNWSQRNQRRPGGQMFRDQHGRRYHAEIELKTGHPCGMIEPMFTAPLMIPLMYLELSKDPERPYDLYANWDRYLADTDTERAEWTKEGRQRSMKLYGEKYRTSDPFTAEVLEIIGPPPLAREPILAASQGNKWILGLTDRVDVRLFAFFEPESLGETYRPAEPDFSEVVEYVDDAKLEAQQDQARESAKAHDRERKQKERDARRAALTPE